MKTKIPNNLKRFFSTRVVSENGPNFPSYDFVQSMDVFSLTAGLYLKKRAKCSLIIDFNELPDVKGREVAKNLDKTEKELLNKATRNLAKQVEGSLTTCGSLSHFTKEFLGIKPLVVRNARKRMRNNLSGTNLRAELGLNEATVLIAFPATAAPSYGAEESILALNSLPKNICLVFIGRFSNMEYATKIKKLVQSSGLASRVFFKGPYYGEEYTNHLSSCDIGISPLPLVGGSQYYLPSRLLDSISAELFLISSNFKEFEELNREYNIGIGFNNLSPQSIAKSISNYLELEENEKRKVIENVKVLKEKFTEELEQKKYLAHVDSISNGTNRRAAFVCNSGIENNRRVGTFCGTLEKKGFQVDVYCIQKPKDELCNHLKNTSFIELGKNRKFNDKFLVEKLFFSYYSELFLQAYRKFRKAITRKNKSLYRKIVPRKTIASRYQLSLINQFSKSVSRLKDFKPDIIVAHDILAAKAGLGLLKQNPNARLVLDVTEIPDLTQRNGINFRALSSSALNKFKKWENEFVEKSDLIYTLCKSFKDFLMARYETNDVRVLHNSNPRPMDTEYHFRSQFNFSKDDVIVAFVGGALPMTGAMQAISAMNNLPANIHLLFLGNAVNNAFKLKMLARAKKLNVTENVHFFDPIYSEDYLNLLSNCDIGLISFRTDFMQTKLVIPNRFFDYVAAGLPILTTRVDDVENFVQTNDIGITISELSAKSIANGIKNLISKYDIGGGSQANKDVKARLANLADDLAAEDGFTKFGKEVAALVENKPNAKVAVLARQRLHSNVRMIRQCRALADEGLEVELIGINEGPASHLAKKLGDVKVRVFPAG